MGEKLSAAGSGSEDGVHALLDVGQMLAAARVDLRSRPAVVADLAQRAQDPGPVLVAFADAHPALRLAVALEVELEQALSELPDPFRGGHAELDHVRAVE